MSDTGHTPLPCPFCGGEAELDTAQAYRALSGGALGSRAAVYCTRCGGDMGFCYEDAPGTPHEDIVNQVLDDWNRRASPSLPILVEALEPFAEASDKYHPHIDSETPLNPAPFPGGPDSVNLVVGHLRRARAALASIKGGDNV